MPTPSPTPDLQEAIAHHGAGRLAEAGTLYRRVLAADPHALEALHGLALIAIDLGQPDRALPLLGKCLEVEPKNGLYLTSLGLTLLRKGDNSRAASLLLDAANLMPSLPEPRLYLARALGNLGRWGQAADVLSASAEVFPANAEIWAAKGHAERVLLRHAQAEESLRRALRLSPNDADILNNLAVVLRAQERVEEAIGFYQQALAQAPDRALIHANLGNALTHLGRGPLGETHLRRAVQLEPGNTEARTNLAAYLTAQERPADAIPHFRAVLEKAPGNVDAWTNLGVALLDTGDTAEAERCYRRAIALAPKNSEAHYNLAWILLLTGQWREGWQEYEWRWRLTNFSSRKRSFAQPLWDGAAAGTLLLHAEQGFGDAIQFVRYAALTKTRCTRVIVECPRPLVKLFETVAGVDQIVAAGTALPDFDAHAPFMSLPRLFDTTPGTVPGSPSYMRAPLAPASLCLPETGRKRIGVVWAGSPDNKIDRRRTIPAKLLALVLAECDADIVSLQVGPRAEEVIDLPPNKVVLICDGRVKDFAETAAVVDQLDLVIGVDTAVMHLAGALGKPAWMLIPFMPDYRWLLRRADTPWYPSIRLFRQEKPGDWHGVAAVVRAALTTWQPG